METTRFVELVDEQDRVVGRADEEEVRKKNLLHHSVHIAVIDSKGRLFCAHREKNKPVYGGWWTVPGAHVFSGETYEKASARLLSELKLAGRLERIEKIRVDDGFENEFSTMYVFKSDSIPTLKPSDWEGGKFLALAEARQLKETQKTTLYLQRSLNYLRA
jgi:isopentenyldiphosphate isomerase